MGISCDAKGLLVDKAWLGEDAGNIPMPEGLADTFPLVVPA